MVLPGFSYYLPSNPAELIGALPEFGDGYPYYDQLPRELSTDSPRDGEPRGRRALSHGAAAMDGGPPAPSSGGPGRCRLACARPPAAVRSRTSVRWCRRAGRAGLVAWAGSRVVVRARNPRPGQRISAGPANPSAIVCETPAEELAIAGGRSWRWLASLQRLAGDSSSSRWRVIASREIDHVF